MSEIILGSRDAAKITSQDEFWRTKGANLSGQWRPGGDELQRWGDSSSWRCGAWWGRYGYHFGLTRSWLYQFLFSSLGQNCWPGQLKGEGVCWAHGFRGISPSWCGRYRREIHTVAARKKGWAQNSSKEMSLTTLTCSLYQCDPNNAITLWVYKRNNLFIRLEPF